MTPLCKYIAILLITGDVVIYEAVTGIFVSGIATGQKNTLGVWLGHEKLEDEFKPEGNLSWPLCGHNKLYEDLGGIPLTGQKQNILTASDEQLKPYLKEENQKSRLARNEHILSQRQNWQRENVFGGLSNESDYVRMADSRLVLVGPDGLIRYISAPFCGVSTEDLQVELQMQSELEKVRD